MIIIYGDILTRYKFFFVNVANDYFVSFLKCNYLLFCFRIKCI